MPTINKPKNKTRYVKHGKDAEIRKIYNTTQWRKLRAAYLLEHPLCEDCLDRDEVREAVEVHHVRPISTGYDTDQMKTIAYDADNLVALCAECHHKRHGKR